MADLANAKVGDTLKTQNNKTFTVSRTTKTTVVCECGARFMMKSGVQIGADDVFIAGAAGMRGHKEKPCAELVVEPVHAAGLHTVEKLAGVKIGDKINANGVSYTVFADNGGYVDADPSDELGDEYHSNYKSFRVDNGRMFGSEIVGELVTAVEPVDAIVIHVSPEQMQQAIDEDTPVALINTVKPCENLSTAKPGDVLVLNIPVSKNEKCWVVKVSSKSIYCVIDQTYEKAIDYYEIYGAEACFSVGTGIELSVNYPRTALYMEHQPQQAAVTASTESVADTTVVMGKTDDANIVKTSDFALLQRLYELDIQFKERFCNGGEISKNGVSAFILKVWYVNLYEITPVNSTWGTVCSGNLNAVLHLFNLVATSGK